MKKSITPTVVNPRQRRTRLRQTSVQIVNALTAVINGATIAVRPSIAEAARSNASEQLADASLLLGKILIFEGGAPFEGVNGRDFSAFPQVFEADFQRAYSAVDRVHEMVVDYMTTDRRCKLARESAQDASGEINKLIKLRRLIKKELKRQRLPIR